MKKINTKGETYEPRSTKLNIGSGVWLRKGYINIDKYFTLDQLKTRKGQFKNAKIERGAEYLQADILELPLPNDYATRVEVHQVLEHINMHRVVDAMKEIHRVMKPNAKLILDVPSFSGIAADWLKMITSTEFNVENYYNMAEVVFGNQYADSEGEVHKTPFTPQFMNFVLSSAGFTNGSMYILPKGSKFVDIGELSKPKKGATARHDILIVEAIK